MQRRRRCLVLGAQGSGKSLLVKKTSCCSRRRHGRGDGEDDAKGYVSTKPTMGVSVEEPQLEKNVTLLVKEYGGAMAPVWSGGYSDCDMVAYVIDATDCTAISASTILLLEVLEHQALSEKPFLLVFNKLDRHCPMSLTQFKSVMRLEDILRHAKQNITVVEGNCIEPESSLVDDVWKWFTQAL